MLLNIFLIMELGLLIGSFLSRFRNRFVPYFTMILAAYLVSPYSEELAGQISQSTDGKSPVYRFVELFNIMPLVYTKFAPNYSFGESLLPYRVALILFWCAAVLTGIFLSVPRIRKWGKLSVQMKKKDARHIVLLVSVKDTGIGIKESVKEVLSLLFI